MSSLETFARAVDRLVDGAGRAVSWLIIPVVLALFVAVPLRYVFHYASSYLDDWPQMGHSALFLIGAAYALLANEHVRVDVFRKGMGPRRRAVVDLAGTLLLLLPWLGVVGWYAWPLVRESWHVREGFGETMTPGYFISKTLVLVFVALVGLQALANAARALRTLIGGGAPDSAADPHP